MMRRLPNFPMAVVVSWFSFVISRRAVGWRLST